MKAISPAADPAVGAVKAVQAVLAVNQYNKPHQIDGIQRIIQYGIQNGYRISEIAYALGTAEHETAKWFQPIREGAVRYGPAYTDAQAQRAVKAIFDKGIIKTNYALQNASGLSFYGRGLIQITHEDNYKKFNKIAGVQLDKNPDLALEWKYALMILYIGMKDGMFRKGFKLSMIPDEPKSTQHYIPARSIVNGDVKLNGALVAGYAMKYYNAMKG